MYAVNGVGKSYLARVFYILEQLQRENEIKYATEILLNHNSKQGSLSFKKLDNNNKDATVYGQLEFYNTNSINANRFDSIFHVFTDEYVENEVRSRHYNFDNVDLVGIPLGNSKIEYSSIKRGLTNLNYEKSELRRNLETKFDWEKKQLFNSKFFAGKNNVKNQNLDFGDFLQDSRKYNRRRKPKLGLSEILYQLENLTAVSKFINNNQMSKINVLGTDTLISELCQIEYNSNEKSQSELKSIVNSKLKDLHPLVRESFLIEFANENHQSLTRLKQISREEAQLNRRLRGRRNERVGENQREEFAKTFQELLDFFFGSKYSYDPLKLVLKLNNLGMTYPHHSLSDGDKSVIDFCYYIASIHYKLQNSSDFKKLFLIIDDPVSSMSFDYIHAVCHVLKNLKFSKEGKLVIFGQKGQANQYTRPKMLIMTHSTYFFNLCRENGIVRRDAAFWLFQDKKTHNISKFDAHLSPFFGHLLDIYKIAYHNYNYSHTTGNSMRCVLENIWRFRCPNKNNLGDFISGIHDVDGAEINKILLDSESHNGPDWHKIPNEMGKRACKNTLKIVKKYAPGQLKLIKQKINKNIKNTSGVDEENNE